MVETVTSIIFGLREREIRCDSRKRTDLRILRSLICHSNREFTKVWTRKANKSYHYESGRLYSDNYTVCHYGYTTTGGPKEIYAIPKNDPYERNKLEDALIYKCFHENFHKFDNQASLIALRTRNMGESVVQYDLSTGELIREIFLSPAVKFKYIAWIDTNHMFMVKSVHSSERSQFHMMTGISMNIAIVIVVFSAFPLEFVGMFEVDRRIFGHGITNAILSHGLLIVMYITGFVKFFSFEYILEKFKRFHHSIPCVNTGRHSSHHARENWITEGLPMNIKITECPPVLFEVQCSDHDVQIGGFPWHYIFTPRGTLGMFNILSLKDNKKAKNGTLLMNIYNSEPDSCVFYGDNSGRILYISGTEVRVLELRSPDNADKPELLTLTTINVQKQEKVIKEQPQKTSSGRKIKRRQTLDEVYSTVDTVIHHVDYEDELDLMWISFTHQNSSDTQTKIQLYDNKHFQLLKEIELDFRDQTQEYLYENTVYIDLDTIVQVLKPRLGQFLCTVYRLSGDLNQVVQSGADRKQTQRKHSLND